MMHERVAVYRRSGFLYFFAGITSLILSYWVNNQDIIVNHDGICYLLSAQAFSVLGLHGVMQLCPQSQWPFYPLLIHLFVQFSHLSYHLAAYMLDSVFTCITVVTFILIIKELGGTRRVCWLAAGVILLAHEFNSVREYIVRDHGFWACYLLSLFFLLRFFHKPTYWMALAWGSSLLIATLFRIEGAIFLMALPLLSWCYAGSFLQRTKNFFLLNVLSMAISVTLLMWL